MEFDETEPEYVIPSETMEEILEMIPKVRNYEKWNLEITMLTDLHGWPEKEQEMLEFLKSKDMFKYTEITDKIMELDEIYGSNAEYWDEETEEWVSQDEMRRRKAQRGQ